MKTVAIPMKTVARAMRTVVTATRPLKIPWDIWNAVRFVLKYSILRELSFITLSAFPAFGNQIARLSKRAAHLVFLIVSKGSLNCEKSQFKMEQLFGRNRKNGRKGGSCIFRWFAEGSNTLIIGVLTSYRRFGGKSRGFIKRRDINTN